jgi:RHS repeat-associated protein
MTCRVESGITFKQDYNAENRISAIHKMNGDCSTGTATESWLYGYDGDGVRVATAHYTGVTLDSMTLYYMGGMYEVTGSAVKKYYSMAGQTVMRDSDDSLKYLLTDHLGSISAVANQAGELLEQQRYLPFGEVRAIPDSPIIATDFGYTFQRNLSGTGLMDYKSRMYSPQLGRFIQPDSIVPYPVFSQSWNRFSYVMNNPINFIDPTGHQNCGPDNIYCGGLPENNYYSQPRPSLSKTSVSLDKPGCGVDGKSDYGFHCTLEDLDGATMKQRLDWFVWLTENMNENIGEGTSDWFNNIKTIVAGFVGTGQDDNDWLLTVDANILVAVQDGYVAHLTEGPTTSGSGADLWKIFFDALEDPGVTEDELIGYWGAAELTGTNEGLARAAELRYGGNWMGVDWIYRDMGFDDLIFTGIGTAYRLSGKHVCPWANCVGGFFDPRTIWLGSSPVGFVELPIYFFDAFGAAFTGH